MKHLDLTLASPAENLACDEALLQWCDQGDGPELLRFWEPQQPFVVVGYSNRVEREVHVPVCHQLGIPILRRCSGGGAVLQGPGCLNYSLVLRMDSHPALATVTGTNRFVMERNRAALANLLALDSQPPEARSSKSEISVCGHTDLVLGGRKFSGNAHRRLKSCLLFHGTFLLHFDVGLVEKLLHPPSRPPLYRRERSHGDFLRNLDLPAAALKHGLQKSWQAGGPLNAVPRDEIRQLVRDKYSTAAWNFKF